MSDDIKKSMPGLSDMKTESVPGLCTLPYLIELENDAELLH